MIGTAIVTLVELFSQGVAMAIKAYLMWKQRKKHL